MKASIEKRKRPSAESAAAPQALDARGDGVVIQGAPSSEPLIGRQTDDAHRELTRAIGNSPRVLQQRSLLSAMTQSPTLVSQRSQVAQAFGMQPPQGENSEDAFAVQVPQSRSASRATSLAGVSMPIQRKVGPRPDGAFAVDSAWAAWFSEMTAEEVREEAARLDLSRGDLEHLSKLVTTGISIPLDYGDQLHVPQEDPRERFLDGSEPAPIDIRTALTRADKVTRRVVKSPVLFIVRRWDARRGEYVAEDRAKNLKALPHVDRARDFNYCFAHAAEAVRLASGRIAIRLSEGRYIEFITAAIDAIGDELATLYAILYEEPEPRSGAARAAADDEEGALRDKRDTEALYAAPLVEVGHPEAFADLQTASEHSTFTSTIQGGMIVNTMVHKGPWAKGSRSPSQIGVMGQNAKNYFLDQFIYQGNPKPSRKERQEDLDELGGRFEWLHIIGSSLGGANVVGNLVCGTYDANTEMIALEHRVALWGKRGYKGSFAPTPDTPIKIVGIALLSEGVGFIAEQIILLVYHGEQLVLRRAYNALQESVLTKAKYRAAEKDIERDIETARGGLKDETSDDDSDGEQENGEEETEGLGGEKESASSWLE